MEADIVKIVLEGEKKGRPDAPANLGYFEREVNGERVKENADNVCALVVHYDFENARDPKIGRRGDKKDVINLERTFKQNQNCNFRSLLSPKKEVLLQLLGDQDSLLRFFGSKDVIPSVFVLYILSHGDREGVIYTDHYKTIQSDDFVSFTTKEIFESLKQLSGFEDCFKIVNFGPCRGEIDDVVFNANLKPTSMKNENSTQITFSPRMRNLVVFYSTVETTRARRNASGSTFAYLSCQVLDSLEKDEPVINVLTSVQLRVHLNLESDYDFKERKYLGQTPEVKLFAHSRNFILCKSLNSPISYSASTSDGVGVRPEKPAVDSVGEFFPWASPSGEKMRHRHAYILFTVFDHMVKGMIEGLWNLDFEVSDRTVSAKNWELYVEEASSLTPNVGCIITCLFAQVSETSDTNEVCILVNDEEKKISEFLHGFIGPKNDKWIGKPKIFFVLNQTVSDVESDHIRKTPNYNISATNHSGWLVLVLHDKEKQQKLIDILKGQELKRGKCLQELLATLLISKENKDLLNTTLQFRLDFPDFPRSFVKLDFSFMMDGEYFPFETIGFDELLKRANSSKVSKIWLLSSDAGAGKSTVLREMAFQLKKSKPGFKIFRIALSEISFNTNTRKLKEFEFLAKFTHHSLDEVSEFVKRKKCIVSLDGFDEISPEFREKMLKLVEVLKQEQISVWIGTRPHVVEAIKRKVSDAVLVKIERLNFKSQVELYQMETGRSENDCKTFIRNFPLKDILENPLHLSLVAQCGDEDNLYKIYDKVIRHKVEKCLVLREGYGIESPKFQEKVEESISLLQNIAFRYIDHDGYYEIDADFEKINCLGVGSFEYGNIDFLHQTFAEFLTTQKFIRDITENGLSNVPLFDLNGKNTVGIRYHCENFGQSLKFLDLFYSSFLNNEKSMKVHREAVLATAKSNPANFMKLVIWGNLKYTLGILKPYISFSERGEDYIFVENDIELLTLSIENADEIAAQFIEMDFLENEAQLVEYLPRLLSLAEEYNAISFLKGLRQKFSSLPELIKSKESEICAGSWAIRIGNDTILDFLVQMGVGISNLEESLFISCSKGNINYVKILLKHGAKGAKTRRANEYRDPLIVAVEHSHLNLVKFLLEEKISGLKRDAVSFEIDEFKEGWNAFHCSIFHGRSDIAKYLLEKSPNIKSLVTANDESPLHLAVMRKNLDTCLWLVNEVGVDLNALLPSGHPKNCSHSRTNLFMDYFVMLQRDNHRVDERGKTALICAVEHGYVKLAHKLIESGVNIRANDKHGWNAFHFACFRLISDTETELIQLLHNKDGLLAKETTEKGQTGLHIVIESCDRDFNKSLLDYLIDKIGIDALKIKDNTGRKALDIASERKLNCFEYLMTKYVQLDFRNKKGQSCLHVAAEMGDLEALRTWITLGGDLSHQDQQNGWTALHFAALRDQMDFVNELLVSGVDVNLLDKFGRTALHVAVRHHYFYSRTFEFLLKNGADVNKADFEGSVPLHFAAQVGHTDAVDKLLEFGGDLTLTDSEGINAAQYAINQFSTFRFIATKNIDLVKQRLHNGDTSLHLAIRSESFDSFKVFQWLVDQGVVDLNAINNSSETVLLLACKLKRWSISKQLLRKHVDVHAKDREGKCALDYAENVEFPDLELVQKLKELV